MYYSADNEKLLKWYQVEMMQFVQYAPQRNGIDVLPIKVGLMSQADADYWHKYVQPDIRNLAASGAPDAQWNWSSMRRWLPLVELLRSRRAPAFTVWAEGSNNRAVPISMILLSEGYSALDDDSKQCVYIWFMGAAPEATMRQRFGMQIIPKLGRVLIDIAVTQSHNLGYGGRIGLHAAPAGGQKLVDMYRNFGLNLLPSSARLPAYIRSNDGRYFYLNELQAGKWSNSLNSYR